MSDGLCHQPTLPLELSSLLQLPRHSHLLLIQHWHVLLVRPTVTAARGIAPGNTAKLGSCSVDTFTPSNAREMLPKCSSRTEVLHSCASSLLLATSCLGETRERRAPGSSEVEEFSKPPENIATQQFFFYPNSVPFKTLAWEAGCLRVSEPASTPFVSQGLGWPQPTARAGSPVSGSLASAPGQAQRGPSVVRDPVWPVSRNKWTNGRKEARNPHGGH